MAFNRRIWLVVVAACGALAVLFATLLLDDATFTWLIREEHPIELLGALSLLAAAVFSVLAWRRASTWAPLARLSLLALALLFFFGFGEEISWGQRIFGVETPESLREANRQDETNLHNLNFFSGALDADNIFRLFWLTFGVLLPVLALWDPARRVLCRLVVLLPAPLAVGFIANQVLASAMNRLLDAQPELYNSTVFPVGHSVFEIKETGACLLLAVGMGLTAARTRRAPAPDRA